MKHDYVSFMDVVLVVLQASGDPLGKKRPAIFVLILCNLFFNIIDPDLFN